MIGIVSVMKLTPNLQPSSVLLLSAMGNEEPLNPQLNFEYMTVTKRVCCIGGRLRNTSAISDTHYNGTAGGELAVLLLPDVMYATSLSLSQNKTGFIRSPAKQ